MKTINGIKKFEPSQCYFYCAEIEEQNNGYNTLIFITPIYFWKENRYLSDSFAKSSLEDKDLPDSLVDNCLTDSTWSSEEHHVKVRQQMLDKGFVECQEFATMLIEP